MESNSLDDGEESDIKFPEDDEGLFADLPPDFATVGTMGTEPMSIDDALQGSNADKWQAALDYEINQLKKLGIWMIDYLPAGQTAILNSIVLKEKWGLIGDIKSYWVWIVAGGCKQKEGVNYAETFLATVKMPSVWVVLVNEAE